MRSRPDPLRGVALETCEVGASAIEHTWLVVLVALAALASWSALGDSVETQIDCASEAIAGALGPCRTHAAVGARTAALVNERASTRTTAPVSDIPLSARPYEDQVAFALAGAQAHFGELSANGDRITTQTLTAALSSGDPAVRETAELLLRNDSVRNAMDIGNHGGHVDGEIGEEDLAGFRASLAEEDLRTLLADTADGGGGNDDHIGEDDLRAMMADDALPEVYRQWAAEQLASGAYDDDEGCGWNLLCHAGRGATATWHAVGAGASYVGRVGRGFVGAAWDTAKGLYTLGKNIVLHPIGSLRAVGEAIVHPTKLWRLGTAIVSSVWGRVKAAAHGDPEAIGGLAFDVVLTVGTGGAGAAAKTGKLALLARSVVERIPGGATLLRHLDDLRAPAVLRGHAFGMHDNPIQYSWEFEGKADEILRYYRPHTVADAEWRTLSLAERQARSDPNFFNYVRTDDAPAFLTRNLDVADTGVWETKTQGYVGTTEELFEQARFVDRNLNRRGGGFHMHVSFRPNPAHADEITDFLAQADEYVALKLFANGAKSVHTWYLGPTSLSTFERIRRGLAANRIVANKLNSVGFRAGVYEDASRVGFEIRGISSDLEASARVVDGATRFLEDPANAVIRLGDRGPGYHVSDVAGVDRIGLHVLDRLPPDAQQFLREAAESAPYGIDKPALLERWTMPMVRWEERSYFPAHVREQVVSFREQYVDILERMARSAHRPSPDEVQFALESMISEWSSEIGLYHYY